jgi:hypothetical protein
MYTINGLKIRPGAKQSFPPEQRYLLKMLIMSRTDITNRDNHLEFDIQINGSV